jgi:uncharacterized phage protein gp47/JayE
VPWTTPTLKEVRILVRDKVRGNLEGADASIPNSLLRILSDVSAGMTHQVLQFVDWLSLELMPDTAEQEWLDRHAHMWLKNADGTTGRKLATLAIGQVALTGTTWTPVPIGTRLIGGLNGDVDYETTETVFLASGGAPTPTPARALDPGIVGNLEPGATMRVVNPGPGVDTEASVIVMDHGVDEETTDELRSRVLLRIRNPPQGGANIDYELWALGVPGVTRAWCYALEMGMGTVTVRFMMDRLREDEGGFPRDSDVGNVYNALDKLRPVAVKDMFVVAPIPYRVNVQIDRLIPDTPTVRAAIGLSIQIMLRDRAEPGQTIYAAWKNFAIMSAPGVRSYTLMNAGDDYMPSSGHMPVLGNIIYGETGQPLTTPVVMEEQDENAPNR